MRNSVYIYLTYFNKYLYLELNLFCKCTILDSYTLYGILLFQFQDQSAEHRKSSVDEMHPLSPTPETKDCITDTESSVGESIDESYVDETESCIGENESCVDHIRSFPPRDGPAASSTLQPSTLQGCSLTSNEVLSCRRNPPRNKRKYFSQSWEAQRQTKLYCVCHKGWDLLDI